jgi:hypothetical protein
MPVIPTLRRHRREDYDFQASLRCIARPCLKKKKRLGWALLEKNSRQEKCLIYSIKFSFSQKEYGLMGHKIF